MEFILGENALTLPYWFILRFVFWIKLKLLL